MFTHFEMCFNSIMPCSQVLVFDYNKYMKDVPIAAAIEKQYLRVLSGVITVRF